MNVPETLQTVLRDKYTAVELLDKLADVGYITVDDVLDIYGEEIMEEFCDEGIFEDEWRDLYDGMS